MISLFSSILLLLSQFFYWKNDFHFTKNVQQDTNSKTQPQKFSFNFFHSKQVFLQIDISQHHLMTKHRMIKPIKKKLFFINLIKITKILIFILFEFFLILNNFFIIYYSLIINNEFRRRISQSICRIVRLERPFCNFYCSIVRYKCILLLIKKNIRGFNISMYNF